MGHQRLGRLPIHRNWVAVIRTLGSDEGVTKAVAAAAAKAAEEAFELSADDSGVWYPFWVITQLAATARDQDSFYDLLNQFSISKDECNTTLDLVSALVRHVEEEAQRGSNRNAFSELATDAFQTTVSKLAHRHEESLFETTSENAREALAEIATSTTFADLAQQYLGGYFGKTLAYFVSYEISNHIGRDRRFKSIDDAELFNRELYTYAKDVSLLVKDFGKGWYSKSLWQKGGISQKDARGFLRIAMRKFRQQLQLEAS